MTIIAKSDSHYCSNCAKVHNYYYSEGNIDKVILHRECNRDKIVLTLDEFLKETKFNTEYCDNWERRK